MTQAVRSKLIDNAMKLIAVVITIAVIVLLKTDLPTRLNLVGQSTFIPRLQDFVTLFLGIIIEAFPFVILGVAISTLVGLYVRSEWLVKIIPRNRFLSHFVVSLLGVLMPVCECGNIPVARRLMLKDFSVSQSITFLLAAPIINPITFITTWEAFNFDHSVAIIRIVAAFIIANAIGILFSYKHNDQELLTDHFYQLMCEEREHEHHHHKTKLVEGIDIFKNEFIDITKMLIIGALLAAISQSFIPRDLVIAIGQNPFLSIIAMIVLAFVISICSNVDAFFALSYANNFTQGSILAFLVFGPMIDIKILTMMRSTFRPRVLLVITLLVTLASILVGLLVNYF